MRLGLISSLFVFSVCLNSTVQAENRAKVEHMTVDLRLPDGGSLTVDMDFQCGGYYDKTALIVTNRQGAEILATAYESLYGPDAGKAIMDTWNKKVNKNDPRLPTFLIVRPPKGKSFRAKNVKSPTDTSLDKSTSSKPRFDVSTETTQLKSLQNLGIDDVSGTCGAVDHPLN